MIELTQEQVQAQSAQKSPLQVLNPATREVFVLIRKDVYDLVCGIVKPFNKGVEDDPEMDVYEQYRKQP
jgi:hypothetical protein